MLAGCGSPETEEPPSPEDRSEERTGGKGSAADSTQVALGQTEVYNERPVQRDRSQTLYVPTYSHIHFRDAGRTMNLTTTLSVRNASPTDSITLVAADYYDSDGNGVESYIPEERCLAPLSSTSVVVEERHPWWGRRQLYRAVAGREPRSLAGGRGGDGYRSIYPGNFFYKLCSRNFRR